MGFRNPITTVVAVDTRAAAAGPGVRMYQSPNPDGTGHLYGVVEWSDFTAGDTPARIVQSANPNPRSITDLYGRLAITGGAYSTSSGVMAAPELDLSIEQNAAGHPVRVARWVGADRIIPSQNYIATANASTARSIAATGWTPIQLDAFEANNGGFSIPAGTSHLVVPWDGWYEVSGIVPFAANATGFRALRWNWTQLTPAGQPAQLTPRMAAWEQATSAGGNTVVAQPIPVRMPAGGWIELQAGQGSGAALSTAINADGVPQVSIKLLAPL